ncbi:tripartite tricarboxylate transporter substrate binding protein [Allopusillimonas soli]|uniref:Tripartite tricarboxylate transporter substrate binding protein n=1 Tax=Allopusillimonas soli TaxID=659016 RepID=A0A853FCH3_9BURK|nr:tripartite tricarboxylate transporter substrate binding protein [Allopusillimonas soli]NYT37458.1 tripartite tricarboxylate transporter substrate binding protein [Allopusillimonas soli]TEA74561.1 tripartite tricarboxylate transporter substrate binding protein [Allopusillimonas soli]
MKRLRCIAAAAACVLASGSLTARAQTYPTRPVEWVVPYQAGGGTDIVARTVAEKMAAELGQSIVIVNKPGAATAIGAAYAARAKPDGYVMLTGDTATLAANPALYPGLAYDPQKDFDTVGLLARFAMILVVNPAVPVHNLQEFVEWAKQKKEGVSYGTPGAGSPHHLATELFKQKTGLNLVHVPYRGAAPAVQDVMGGQIPCMFVDSATGQQYISSGMLRPIAVASKERLANLPEVPTLIESGMEGFEAYAWQGLLVPKGTPHSAIETLSKALQSALKDAAIRKKFSDMGLEAIPGTPREMADYASAEREKWGTLIHDAGIKVQ